MTPTFTDVKINPARPETDHSASKGQGTKAPAGGSFEKAFGKAAASSEEKPGEAAEISPRATDADGLVPAQTFAPRRHEPELKTGTAFSPEITLETAAETESRSPAQPDASRIDGEIVEEPLADSQARRRPSTDNGVAREAPALTDAKPVDDAPVARKDVQAEIAFPARDGEAPREQTVPVDRKPAAATDSDKPVIVAGTDAIASREPLSQAIPSGREASISAPDADAGKTSDAPARESSISPRDRVAASGREGIADSADESIAAAQPKPEKSASQADRPARQGADTVPQASAASDTGIKNAVTASDQNAPATSATAPPAISTPLAATDAARTASLSGASSAFARPENEPVTSGREMASGSFAEAVGEIAPRRSEQALDIRPQGAAPRLVTAGGTDAVHEIVHAALSAKGNTTIELRLDPTELGQLDIELSFTDERVSIAVRAEREDAADLMRRSSDELARMLRNAGIDFDSLSFSQGRSEGGDRKFSPFAYAGEGTVEAAPEGTPSAALSGMSNTRVDIRI